MKHLITLLMVACLLVSSLAVAGLAEDAYQYTGTAFMSVGELKAKIDAKEDIIVIGVVNGLKAIVPFSLEGKGPAETTYRVWGPDYAGKGNPEALSPNYGGFRLPQEKMVELLSKAGATADSTIVIYTVNPMHNATRFYWQVKLLGHENVYVLDGGINAWDAAKYPTFGTIELSKESVKSEYVPVSYDPATFNADIQTVVAALENPEEWVVIDARTPDENAGKKTGASSGAYGLGALKGAVHINWDNALNKDGTLKTKAELEAIYGDVIEGKKVIAHCQSGVRSAHTVVMLRETLGHAEAYNYDGSWIEWSYVASEAGDDIDAELKAKVLSLTDKWTDNKGAI